MAHLDGIAHLLVSHRAALERAFNSEVLKLKIIHGDRAVAQALAIARQYEAAEWVSIAGSRRRRELERAADWRRQQLQQRKRDDVRADATSLVSLPPAWR